MKRLLLIAYYFPPMGGGGVARPSKFVKYLSRMGWSCSVVSANPRNYWLQDTSRLKDIPPETRVHRTSAVTGIGVLRRFFLRETGDHRRNTQLMTRLRTLTFWFLIPDSFVGWIPFAVIKGWWVCRRDRIDVIVATAPPNSSAVAGWLLSRLTGIPLVTDFRDLWTDEIHFQAPTSLHSAVHRYLESSVLSASSAALFTNPGAMDFMRRKYPSSPHLTAIRMGYDPEDYAGISVPSSASGPIRMVYTGNLTINRPITGLLEAIASRPEEFGSGQLQVFLYGQRDDEKDRDAAAYHLPNVFLKDNVGHDEAVRLQAGADILLFMGYNTNEKVRLVTSGKIYEYLYWNEYFGKPILAISAPMDATGLLSGRPHGRVVPMEDPRAIGEALAELMAVVRRGYSRPANRPPQHAVENSARLLSDLLERILE